MNWSTAVVLLMMIGVSFVLSGSQKHVDIEDTDFAEFADIDDEDTASAPGADTREPVPAPKVIMAPEAAAAAAAAQEAENADDEDATVEEDEDFEHLHDEDEFEGFDKERSPKSKSHESPPDLKITKVPIHLHTNWDSFYMEMLMLAGLGAYLLNFIAGKTKNNKLAQAWLSAHRQLLEENFSVIGDDGSTAETQTGVLMKEAENVYSLWCSGRTCCEGMLVTIKLLKRQDLVSTIARFFRPVSDQIIIKVIMDEAEMEPFVFCLAHKRICTRLQKEHNDLSWYCPEKKSVEKHDVPTCFQLLSESGEVTSYVLDSKVTTAINKFESMIEYLHFSDQYAGPKQPEDSQPPKAPELKKVLIFCFNVAERGRATPRDMEQMKPLLQMVFHCVDKMKRFKLSKEAKLKAERNRQKVQESMVKASHTQRTEAAQARREEKRRAEKDRIMNEDDPEKQRKLEEKNLKKEAKKKQPKVKRMKIKAI